MPSLAEFMESLTQEQDKLVMMGTIKPSKYQSLVGGDSKVDSKGKKKANSKNPPDQKKYKPKSHEESSRSKNNSQKKKGKGEMRKYNNCGMVFHLEISCMKKQIDTLNQILEKHNISLPNGAKKKEGASNFEDNERFDALVASTVRSSSFIIESEDSRHMVSTWEAFSSLDALNGPKIVLGDDYETESKGKDRIDLEHGSFNNVLYVQGLVPNLLLVY